MPLTRFRIATDANITLSAAQTIQGVTLVAATDVVLVGNQNDATQNGIYVVQTGPWTRHTDYDASAEFLPFVDYEITEGKYKNWRWRYVGEANPVIGTAPLDFAPTERDEVLGAGPGVEIDEDLNTVGLTTSSEVSFATKTHISGLVLSRTSSTLIATSEGDLWIPHAGRLIQLPADGYAWNTAFGSNGWLYLYVNYLSVSPIISQFPNTGGYAPAAPYAGYARLMGGPNPAEHIRYIGAVRVDGSGNIYNFTVEGDDNTPFVRYLEEHTAAPFRVLTEGTATTQTNVSCAAVVPPTSRKAKVRVTNSGNAGDARIRLPGGTANLMSIPSGNKPMEIDVELDSSQQFAYLHNTTLTSGGLTVDVLGYRDLR